MENFHKYLVIFTLGGAFGIGILGYIKRTDSKEFEERYAKLVQKSEILQKEVDRLKKEVNNIKVPELKEDQVVDYWKGYLK